MRIIVGAQPALPVRVSSATLPTPTGEANSRRSATSTASSATALLPSSGLTTNSNIAASIATPPTTSFSSAVGGSNSSRSNASNTLSSSTANVFGSLTESSTASVSNRGYGTESGSISSRPRRSMRSSNNRSIVAADTAVSSRRKSSRQASSTNTNGGHDHESTNDGYNSEDEVDGRVLTGMSIEELREKEKSFERNMRKTHGFFIRRVKADGACLFRAAADQVYGDEDMHLTVRRETIEHMWRERDHYSQFVTEDFSTYLQRKSNPRCFGNNLEIQAISEVYGRPVEVFRYSTEPLNIFIAHNSTSMPNLPPIRLSYHRNCHYNSLRNPLADAALDASSSSTTTSTAPVTLVEHLHLSEVIAQSERAATEQILLEETNRQADLERIEAEITAAAVAASLADLTSSFWKGSLSESGLSDGGSASTTTTMHSISTSHVKSPASAWARSHTKDKAKARADDSDSSRPVSPTSSVTSFSSENERYNSHNGSLDDLSSS